MLETFQFAPPPLQSEGDDRYLPRTGQDQSDRQRRRSRNRHQRRPEPDFSAQLEHRRGDRAGVVGCERVWIGGWRRMECEGVAELSAEILSRTAPAAARSDEGRV